MAHQVNITLTDEEYKALSAEVGRDDEELETLLRELLTRHLRTSLSAKGSLNTRDDVERYLCQGPHA